MKNFFNDIKEILWLIILWIGEIMTDEKGNPSAPRHAGFIALFAAIYFANENKPEYIIYGFIGLVVSLFTGAQWSKKFNQSKQSAIPENEQEDETL